MEIETLVVKSLVYESVTIRKVLLQQRPLDEFLWFFVIDCNFTLSDFVIIKLTFKLNENIIYNSVLFVLYYLCKIILERG